MASKVSVFNKWWRPLTAYAIGFNLFIIPWLLLLAYTFTDVDKDVTHLWIFIYGQMVLLFAGLAGIRQLDKHKQHDVLVEMSKIKAAIEEDRVDKDTPFFDDAEDVPNSGSRNQYEFDSRRRREIIRDYYSRRKDPSLYREQEFFDEYTGD